MSPSSKKKVSWIAQSRLSSQTPTGSVFNQLGQNLEAACASYPLKSPASKQEVSASLANAKGD